LPPALRPTRSPSASDERLGRLRGG
jgi:hypothetical protein